MKAKDYIRECLTLENYSFSLDELENRTDGTRPALKAELARLTEKKEVISIRKGFYLIIPPRYSKQGRLPIQLYIDKMFKFLDRNYYVGFYAAARFHGANHQQAQRDYVMIEKPKLNDIEKSAYDIRFFTTSNWPSKNIIQRKSDAGVFNLSSPALTAADLIHHQSKLGGLNRMLAILEELTDEIDQSDLEDLSVWYPHRSTIQRLGYLLELIGVEENTLSPLTEHLARTRFFPVLLSPKSKQRPGAIDNRWKIDVNIKLESDL